MEFRVLSDDERLHWETMGAEAEDFENCPYAQYFSEEEFDAVSEICEAAAADDFAWMHAFLAHNGVDLPRWRRNNAFEVLLKRALEHGVACGDADCCCDLANMYHATDGEGAPEDFAVAIELYERGRAAGCDQASVNLGYIYYYGRGVERDFVRAYECFAQAAVLADNPEAYWKLGDLYAAGAGVAQSDAVAWRLYCRARECAKGSALRARAEHHMADYLMRDGVAGVPGPDPERAFALYADAELAYYELIDHGLTYYERQLEQVIEGQARARQAVQAHHARVRGGAEVGQ